MSVPGIYFDKRTKTYYVSKRYVDEMGNNKRLFKRGFKAQREAKQYMNSFLMKEHGHLDMTFDDFIDVYYNDRKEHLKLNTFLTKQKIIETTIRPFFGNLKLNEVTPAIVMRWQNEILKTQTKYNEKYANSTLKTIHAQLSAVFNHAVKYYGLRQNPANVVGTMGKPEKKEMLFWTQEEYKKFSLEIMDKPISFYAFEVLYWCGIRLGELLALTKEDFDLENKKLRINKSYQKINGEDVITTPKTVNSNRYIDMPDALVEEMQNYLNELYGIKDTDRIFPITKSYLHHEMDRGTKAAGVKRIRIHDLRHSHVSLLIQKGFSAIAIAQRVGHESIRITYKYAHLFPSVGKDIANVLDREMEEGIHDDQEETVQED